MSHVDSSVQLCARVMRPTDTAAVDRLRIDSYQRATWFTLRDPERIRCAHDLPRSRVTAVFEHSAGSLSQLRPRDDAAPVATICQTLVLDRAEAEALLELEAPVSAADFPALVISRAATDSKHSGLRLNHVLRWYTLLAAHRDGIASILGGHAQGTPNLRAMAELGYRFLNVASSSMSQVDVNTQHVMSYLPATDFPRALARLTKVVCDVLPHIEWQGSTLSFDEWLTPEPALQAA